MLSWINIQLWLIDNALAGLLRKGNENVKERRIRHCNGNNVCHTHTLWSDDSEKEREREREMTSMTVCVYVCVCV